MKILLVYGTTEGQTKKIFTYLKESIEQSGNDAELFHANNNPVSPEQYDAVIIGGSMHNGTYQDSVRHYIRAHNESIKSVPNVFISVSLSIVSQFEETKADLEEKTKAFLKQVDWKPDITEQVAGALRFTQYNWLKKMIMKSISKKEGRNVEKGEDTEYTDWEQVKDIVKKITALVHH